MAILKTYSITNDITLGIVDSDTLDSEIRTSGAVNNYDGITILGDNIDVIGDSFSDESGLDQIIANHNGNVPQTSDEIPTINDNIISTNSVWSSDKKNSELDLKLDDSQLNDAAATSSTTSLWSVNKIYTELQAIEANDLQINDLIIATNSLWSSDKTNTEIQGLSSSVNSRIDTVSASVIDNTNTITGLSQSIDIINVTISNIEGDIIGLSNSIDSLSASVDSNTINITGLSQSIDSVSISVSSILNDSITGSTTGWSSQKIDNELDLKLDDSQLNDFAATSSTTSLWSVNKIYTELQLIESNDLQINDSVTATDSVWSSDKTNTEIQGLSSSVNTRIDTVSSSVIGLSQSVDSLSASVTNNSINITGLSQSIDNINVTISNIGGDIVGLSNSIDSVSISVANILNDSITGFTTGWSSNKINSELDTITLSVSDLENELNSLSSSVALNTAKETNVPTSLSLGTISATALGITSDGGVDDVIIPSATTTTAGLLQASDKDKLDNIEANATADQIASEVPYTPTTPSNWETLPTNVGEGLDFITDFKNNGKVYETIWAEENGGLSDNNRQYSFGNGSDGPVNITILYDAEITKMFLHAESSGTVATINLMVNDIITATATFFSNSIVNFGATISVFEGDQIGFRTDNIVGSWNDVRVGVALERNIDVFGLKGEKGDPGIDGTNGGAQEIDYAKRSSTSTQNVTSTPSPIPWQTEIKEGTRITYDSNNNTRLTVTETGTYNIGGFIVVQDATDQRVQHAIEIRINGISTNLYRTSGYNRNAGSSWDYWIYELSTTPFDLNANDYIEIYVQQHDGSNYEPSGGITSVLIGDKSQIWVERYKGAKGNTGAGANIIVQNNDSVIGGVTSELNFDGNAIISATDEGNNKTTITINDTIYDDTAIQNEVDLNTAKVGITPTQASDIIANNAKQTNVPTSLSLGTIDATTLGITSDGGVDDVIIPSGTTTSAGLLQASDKIKINESLSTLGGTISGDLTIVGTVTTLGLLTEEQDNTFGTPRPTALPSLNLNFNNFQLFGSGGPDVSRITEITLNWNLGSNSVFTFNITRNNSPFFVNLLPLTTFNLNVPNPNLTISGSGVTGLDGTYDVNFLNGTDLVLANQNGVYTIYCSTNPITYIPRTFAEKLIGVGNNDNALYNTDITPTYYGQNFNLAQSTIPTTSSSTTPQTKVSLTTTDLPFGRYKVTVNWVWSHTSQANSSIFDVTVDGVTNGRQILKEPSDTSDVVPFTKIFYINTSGIKTIALRYWNESNSTTISDASIELIRVQ